MDNDFYLTLPSNTPGQGLLNTTSTFTTILPRNINLDGQWKVALVELQYPFTWSNIRHGKIQIRLKRGVNGKVVVKQVWVHIMQNHYHSIDALLKHINGKIEDALVEAVFDIDNEHLAKLPHNSDYAIKTRQIIWDTYQLHNIIQFEYNLEINRVEIKLPKLDVVSKISVPEDLMYVLGFGGNSQPFTDERTIAEYPPDMSAGLSAFYVYCDIVDPQIVGDTTAQLLRVVPLNTHKHNYGQIIVESYVNAHYVNVIAKRLCTIKLCINTDQNESVKFNFGKTIVKLHFKKYA